MAWSWVRPVDPALLEGRPLLDLGTGDAATIRGLTGLVVGVDASELALRAARGGRLAAGRAEQLPFRDGAFAVVVAGDLFHHLDDDGLAAVLREVRRVLRPDGVLVAWWYERPARPAPDAPRHPRSFEAVAGLTRRAGLGTVAPLDLEFTIEPAPATVGLSARA